MYKTVSIKTKVCGEGFISKISTEKMDEKLALDIEQECNNLHEQGYSVISIAPVTGFIIGQSYTSAVIITAKRRD